jgi:hypothetical protein
MRVAGQAFDKEAQGYVLGSDELDERRMLPPDARAALRKTARMTSPGGFEEDSRQAERFRALAAIALAGLAVLLVTVAYVVSQFNTVAFETQFNVARHNYHARIVNTARALAPITGSADTARHLAGTPIPSGSTAI